MSWRDRPFCGIDTETTSTDTETARIVTMCAGLATANGWSPRNWLFTQDQPIPEEAVNVHGITTEYANECGTDLRDGLEEFVRGHLYRAWSQGMAVVLYNAVYDLTVIDRELRRCGLAPLEIRGPVVDPYVLERETDPDKFLKKPLRLARLAEIYAALGIDADPEDEKAPGWYTLRITHYRHFGRDMQGDAHGAEPDAHAACRLAWRIGARRMKLEDYSKTGDGTKWLTLSGVRLSDLHQLQVEAYATQRTSFASWLARQGKRIDDPSTDWPLRPFVEQGEVAA